MKLYFRKLFFLFNTHLVCVALFKGTAVVVLTKRYITKFKKKKKR